MNCILKEYNVRPRADALREDKRHDRAVVDDRCAVLFNGHNGVPWKRPICGMFRLLFFLWRPPHLKSERLAKSDKSRDHRYLYSNTRPYDVWTYRGLYVRGVSYRKLHARLCIFRCVHTTYGQRPETPVGYK
jgi:hypothetical protein